MNELKFPDGTIVDGWFLENKILELDNLPKYYLTDYIKPSDIVQTDEIQELIDIIAANNGGVLVVCGGNYKTGALFFKQGVHLYIEKDSMIIGSDDICDYPVMMTRIEGESCLYYPALINAYDVDGFVIYGGGIIDGNGLKSWKAFWQRRKWNPACKNKDEQRPRLVYISNSKNVFISGITMQNSHFWTSHIYKCDKVKFLGCKIYSPAKPVKAPSTDAIDIDACTNVLVHGCDISVNDDAVVLKGGKGPYADTDEQFKNVDSRELLRKVWRLLKQEGYTIGNIDATVLAERPKLAPYLAEMKENIAYDCQTSIQHVNVKATTSETMGFIGRKEGLAAMAVCLLEKQDRTPSPI